MNMRDTYTTVIDDLRGQAFRLNYWARQLAMVRDATFPESKSPASTAPTAVVPPTEPVDAEQPIVQMSPTAFGRFTTTKGRQQRDHESLVRRMKQKRRKRKVR